MLNGLTQITIINAIILLRLNRCNILLKLLSLMSPEKLVVDSRSCSSRTNLRLGVYN